MLWKLRSATGGGCAFALLKGGRDNVLDIRVIFYDGIRMGIATKAFGYSYKPTPSGCKPQGRCLRTGPDRFFRLT